MPQVRHHPVGIGRGSPHPPTVHRSDDDRARAEQGARPGGLEGTTKWFAVPGPQPAAVHARMAATTEIGTGAPVDHRGDDAARLGRGHRRDDRRRGHRPQGQGVLHLQGRLGVRGRGRCHRRGDLRPRPGQLLARRGQGQGERGGLRPSLFSTALGVGAAVGTLVAGRRAGTAEAEHARGTRALTVERGPTQGDRRSWRNRSTRGVQDHRGRRTLRVRPGGRRRPADQPPRPDGRSRGRQPARPLSAEIQGAGAPGARCGRDAHAGPGDREPASERRT